MVVDAGPNDQYTVKVDGSGRVTVRNRRFLRKFEPASMVIQASPSSAPPFTADKDPNQNHWSPLISDHAESQDRSNEPRDSPVIPSQSEEVPLDPTQYTEPATSPPQESGTKLPTALKRLLSHNKEGHREKILTPEEGGRKLRSNVNT